MGFVDTEDRHRVSYAHDRCGHRAVVIIAHGFFNSKDALLLKELGRSLSDRYDILGMDFRGHGKSSGFFTWTAREHRDLLAVLQYAHTHYPKIGVIGFSLGAAISLITAAKTALIDSLVAVSPPTEFGKIDYHFWKLDVENDILYNLGRGKVGKGVRPGPLWLRKERPIDCVTQLKTPVFYIHGERDWLVHPSHSKELFARTAGPKRLAIIKNGPHAEYLIRKNKDETVHLIREWFQETLGKTDERKN